MQGFEKYYTKSILKRLNILLEKGIIDNEQLNIIKDVKYPNIGNQMIENYITDYNLPQGLALNYLINGKKYLVPMVTEEPSVIAASSHGAKIVAQSGGFIAKINERLMIGQIVIENLAVEDVKSIENQFANMLKIANNSHPSIVKRGGGAKEIRLRKLNDNFVSLDVKVDVKEAMGANMLNTMVEAIANYLKNLGYHVLFSSLSNYATNSLVEVSCEIDFKLLATDSFSGKEVAQKISKASKVAEIDVYRATTNNKGIMNGIDAVVLASGNDWRAIEAGIHAYAAKDGIYKGLSKWNIVKHKLVGKLKIPLPVGFVGGSIGIVPLVKINQKIMKINSAKELAIVIASVGLAQNLAALNSLVTEGIQKGHMKLQLKSLSIAVGAKTEEIPRLVDKMLELKVYDSKSAEKILKGLRNGRIDV